MGHIWSLHAIARAEERFAGMNLDAIFEHPSTKSPTKKQREFIRMNCPTSSHMSNRMNLNHDRYLKVSKCGIVFVLEPRDEIELIVTVFKYAIPDRIQAKRIPTRPKFYSRGKLI